jgi:hypothetical protein
MCVCVCVCAPGRVSSPQTARVLVPGPSCHAALRDLLSSDSLAIGRLASRNHLRPRPAVTGRLPRKAGERRSNAHRTYVATSVIVVLQWC